VLIVLQRTLNRFRLVSSLAIVVCALVTTACNRELKSWADAERTHTIVSYQSYLALYPNGPHSQVARQRIDQLKTIIPKERIPLATGKIDFSYRVDSGTRPATALDGFHLARMQAADWESNAKLIEVQSAAGADKVGGNRNRYFWLQESEFRDDSVYGREITIYGDTDDQSESPYVSVWSYLFQGESGRFLIIHVDQSGIRWAGERTGLGDNPPWHVIGPPWTVESDFEKMGASNLSLRALPSGEVYWIYDPPVFGFDGRTLNNTVTFGQNIVVLPAGNKQESVRADDVLTQLGWRRSKE
jgi:hypothetical protein